jgi:cystathionine beta-synthase
MRRSVPTVLETTPLSALDEMLDLTGSVVVVDGNRHPQHILTKIDLVEWLVHH